MLFYKYSMICFIIRQNINMVSFLIQLCQAKQVPINPETENYYFKRKFKLDIKINSFLISKTIFLLKLKR